MKQRFDRSGFIVHPSETMNNKYHASYGTGNINKSTKSFNSYKEAKDYLQQKGVKKALYGSREINTNTSSKPKTKSSSSMFGGGSMLGRSSLGISSFGGGSMFGKSAIKKKNMWNF
jgi:hypothetical protein